MRIGMISTHPPVECGIATYASYLTEALRARGADVYVVCHQGGAGRKVFAAFDYDDPDLADRAFSTTTRFSPDVVHIQHEFGLFGRDLGVNVVPLVVKFRLARLPVVVTLHTVYEEIGAGHKVLYESLLLHADGVIVHDEYQRESLLRQVRTAEAERIHVVPHGAREIEPVPDAKERLGLPGDREVILMIGYFRPSKNFHLIVDLLPDIRERRPEAILVVAGKVRGTEHLAYRNELFRRIETSPEREHIYLLRGQFPQDVFDTVLSAADVVVLPYEVSSQSGILAHALALGRPLVVSQSRGVRTVVERSGTGVVAASPREFVERIVEVLQDGELRTRLSGNASRYVREEIGWSHVAGRHLDIYRSLLDVPAVDSRTIWVD